MNEKEKRKQHQLNRRKRYNPLWQLNAQIKKLREDNGVSVEEFAQRLKTTPKLIEELDNEERFWYYDSALCIARKFGKTFKIDIVDRQ